MGAVPGFGQVEARPARHDILLVFQEILEDLLQGQDAGLVIHQRQHDDAEGIAQLRVQIQVVQHHVGHHVGAQLDDDAHTAAVRFIAQVRDAVEDAVLDHLGDAFQKARLVDLVGNFRHDDAVLALRHVFNFTAGLDPHDAAARIVGLADARAAQDDAARREIRPLDGAHQFLRRHVGIVDEQLQAVHDLAQVVGRDVRRHADGDACRPVDQQFRHLRRQYGRLLEGLVVVRHEIDRFLVDVLQHGLGHLRHAHFRVTHGRGAVAVDAAEVAVAVDEQVARIEILGQAHRGVVHGRIAVRMVLT